MSYRPQAFGARPATVCVRKSEFSSVQATSIDVSDPAYLESVPQRAAPSHSASVSTRYPGQSYGFVRTSHRDPLQV